ncbi:hypothetical protein GCM10023336_38220 [Streptomyces similanensis]|uniref:UvrD-like helicase ATP-binding domain-containing protein n=1 Tax=Streptomyces similanensis TaxID=1274988 RepID=A0ABP9KLD0_9ACTN
MPEEPGSPCGRTFEDAFALANRALFGIPTGSAPAEELEQQARSSVEEDVTRTVLTALREGRHFKVEAGAGAGKTSSLIETFQSILADRPRYLPRPHQRILWPHAHMTSEQGVRAHLDPQGGAPHGVLLPIHWGASDLARTREGAQTLSREWPVPELALRTARGLDLVAKD